MTLIIIFLFANRLMLSQQISVNRIELMPNIPAPYEMRNWKKVALGYDSLVFNLNASGEYLPLIFINNNPVNYPEHKSFGLHTVVGTPYTNSGEAINVLPAVIGASLSGVDKSNQNGYNWVLMCEEYFNRRPAENVYLNSPNSSSGNDWWYETMPNIFFYQLYSMYPNTGDFKNQFTTVAERWLQAVSAMGGSTVPWHIPYMNYRAWKLSTMTPNAEGVIEPEAAGAIAWILYMAYTETGDEKYRQGAELALEFLNSLASNPAYELQLPYGAYIASRMNAELGTNYNIQKIIDWCFDVGPLRSWGAILGRWGGYDVYGLIGEVYQEGSHYAFLMNCFEQAGALVPLVRYDKRFARAIGKWMLNAANAARLFYPKYLPEANQDSYAWTRQYDPGSYIAHEAIRQTANGKSPFATGDAISGGWGKTTLSLYSSSHSGIFGAIIDTTNVEKILRLDLLKTDYFHKKAYPSYLYFNPYTEDKLVEIDAGSGTHDIYDAVSGSFIKTGASGTVQIAIPADGAVIAVITPSGGTVTYEADKMLINGTVVDYLSGHAAGNYPPRIKSLSSDTLKILPGKSVRFYCTAEDRDNDSLFYFWQPSGGRISGSGPVVEWTAPDSAGRYLISCVVTDIKGNSDTAFLSVETVERLYTPPVIISIKADPPKVNLGGSTQITCQAYDPDNDSLAYRWEARAGTLSISGSKAQWKAPESAGNYYVKCSVTDSPAGESVQDSVVIPVRDFSLMRKGDLVLYLPFNGSANDESGRGNNGIVNGASLTIDRSGRQNSAYYFNGQDNNITVPNDTSLNFTDGISLCFWMKPAALFDREAFLVSHGSWQNRWKISITGKKIRWTVKTTAGVKDLDSKTILKADSLYFVSALYDGSDFELYINSSLDNISAFSGTLLKISYDLTVGQMLPGDRNYNYSGELDDIRLYNYSIPVSEIKSLYSMPVSVRNENKKIPSDYLLMQNYPNPFNPETDIIFHMPVSGRISLTLFDILGRRVAVLLDEYKSAGVYSCKFSINDYSLSSGVYYYCMKAEGFMQVRKMMVVK